MSGAFALILEYESNLMRLATDPVSVDEPLHVLRLIGRGQNWTA